MSLLTIILDGKTLLTGTFISGITMPKPPDPPPDPTPSPNPFIGWKAEGLTLYDIVLWRLHRGLTAAEWDQAVAAGYPREDGARTEGPSGFPSGFDLTGTERGTGVRNPLQPGNAYTFSWKASFTGPAYWHFEVNPTEGGATATAAAWDGSTPVQFMESNRKDFQAIAGQTHTITLQLDGRATVATIVRPA
jgi:hypothetical protein